MLADRELSEYYNLCATLRNLQERFLVRRQELKELIEEAAALRRDALLALEKANRLTRHLTGRQRQTAGLCYHPGEIKARINQAATSVFKVNFEETASLSEIRQEFKNHLELKRMGLAVIKMIDSVKKNLLQLDLLEMRCRELVLAINKAMEAFRHEIRIIRHRIYPFGAFSVFRRFLRNLLGRTYFSSRDMDDIGALGNITGLVLKIADSSLV